MQGKQSVRAWMSLGGLAVAMALWCPVASAQVPQTGPETFVNGAGLAWLDRYLKPRREQRDDALARLLTRTFDGSADRSSIGQGRFDPVTAANEPYLIEGLAVRDRLSPFYPSSYAFDKLVCDDVRAGCPGP